MAFASGDITLLMTGHQPVNNNMNLFLKALQPSGVTSELELFILSEGDTSASGDASGTISRTMPLFLEGPTESGSPNFSMNLFVRATIPPKSTHRLNLFCKQRDAAPSSGTLDLFILGPPTESTSGINSSITLFIEGASGTAIGITGNMNLYIGRPNISNSLDLFVMSAEGTSSGNIPLSVEGTIPSSGTLELSIPNTQDNKTATLKLYTHGF